MPSRSVDEVRPYAGSRCETFTLLLNGVLNGIAGERGRGKESGSRRTIYVSPLLVISFRLGLQNVAVSCSEIQAPSPPVAHLIVALRIARVLITVFNLAGLFPIPWMSSMHAHPRPPSRSEPDGSAKVCTLIDYSILPSLTRQLLFQLLNEAKCELVKGNSLLHLFRGAVSSRLTSRYASTFRLHRYKKCLLSPRRTAVAGVSSLSSFLAGCSC